MRCLESHACCLLVLALVLLPLPAAADEIGDLLESGQLKGAYNPVLLDFLLEEGAESLPEAQRVEAIDQMVSALKQDIEITPEEQRAVSLAAAGAGLAQLLGGSDVSDLGSAAQGATYQIWDSWIDSAFTLRKAGYTEEANGFFVKCIEIYPYSDLKGRCAVGLALANPDEAVERLMALTEGSDEGAIKAALRLLGDLAASDGFPAEQRAEVIQRLEVFTGGLKKATYGVAACDGLVRTRDQGAVPTLQKLSKGMMNADFQPCARRGLLLTFEDRSVVPMLEKQLKGGSFSTTEPWQKLFAGRVLIQADEASGYSWAGQQFAKKKSKGMKKFMKTEKETDFKPSLVRILVASGSDEALKTLQAGIGSVEKGSWIETWIAIGMLELGDTSRIDLARAALTRPEWGFTVVRVSTALAEHGDYSGVAALQSLYDQAAQGIEAQPGKAALAYLAGEGIQYENNQSAKKARLLRLRRQIAGALSTIDTAESAAVLTSILEDDEPSVRASAAYGLADMTDAAAAAGLVRAMQVDYGTIGDVSRNPVVTAHVVRRSESRFSGEPSTDEVQQAGLASSVVSVKFLARCVQQM